MSAYAEVGAFLDEHAPALAERALARIEGSQPDYGTSYLFTARRHLVAELAEELVDGAAWAALISERLRHDDDPESDRATALLASIAGLCVEADRLVDQLRPLIAGLAAA